MGYYAGGGGTLKLKKDAVISDELIRKLGYSFEEIDGPSDGKIGLYHPYDKYYEDSVIDALNEIAPLVDSGDIEFSGDDDYNWRFHFYHGTMREQNGRIVYEDDDKDQRHSDRMELLGCLIDAVEDWLESKGITADDIPCEDRDLDIADGEDPESCAIIYGEDYDILSGAFERTLISAELLEKEW